MKRKNDMKTTLKLASALLALGATTASLGLITPAYAQDSNAASISIANLNLATARGQRLLSLRIHRAAETLCYDANDRLDSRVRKAGNICRNEVTSSARAAIGGRATVQVTRAKTVG